MSAEVISMADFRESAKTPEVQPVIQEKPKTDFESEMMDAALLMSHIGETTNHDIATLYFIWADALDILIECGWTMEDLKKEVDEAVERIAKEEEDE